MGKLQMQLHPTKPERLKMSVFLLDSPDTLLRRKSAAAALTGIGYPISDKTLATMASRGGGPTYRRFGRIPLYRWGDLLAWAEGRLSAPICSTSEEHAQRVVAAR